INMWQVAAVALIYEIHHHAGRWVVRLGNLAYGDYLTGEQAQLDAIEAANDARESGHDAEVWDRSTDARVFWRMRGQTVQELRHARGLSQAQLAESAHITLDALRNLESGNTTRPRTIERVARALGLTPMQL